MQPIIHVGYSKCASTFLQREVFPNHEEIAFFGKNLSGNGEKFYPGAKELTGTLINLETFNGLDSTLVQALNNFRNNNRDKILVWSNELFCESVAPFLLFEQLAKLLPDAKVFIVIRRQADIIQSMYKYKGYNLQFSPRKYRGRHVSFFDWYHYAKENYLNVGGHKARDWSGDYLRIIDYNSFVKVIESHFKAENIVILPYERLSDDIGQVYDMLGVPRKTINTKSKANKSSNSFVFHKIADILGIRRGFGLGLAKKYAGSASFDKDILKDAQAFFKSGNEALDNRYKLGLGNLGYF